MDGFGSLSIEDEFERSLNEDELLGISNLSISDSNQKISAAILDKYRQHFPACPSPLRNSLNFVEAFSDQMDIDEECEEKTTEVIVLEKAIQTEEEDFPRVSFQLPTNVKAPVKPKKPRRKKDIAEEMKPKMDSAEEESVKSTNVIKALMSPTSLGIAAATKIDGIPIDYSIDKENETKKELDKAGTSAVTSTGWDAGNLKEELRTRSRSQPIHVSINNHHHYYADQGGYYSQPVPSPSIYKQDSYDRQDRPLQGYGRFQLPDPWSEKSQPVSKNSYAIITYLQLFLNCITITAIFSFLTSLIRTLRKDIKSTWEHRKLELDYESSLCRNQYLLNECNIGVRPALQEQCQQWGLCMDRNNDIFFRARTTLSAKLFGEIINSFIEPIGWKALSVIIISLVIWCFCSNFILGFARAKSYYGDPTRQLLMLQHQHQEQRARLELSEQTHQDNSHDMYKLKH